MLEFLTKEERKKIKKMGDDLATEFNNHINELITKLIQDTGTERKHAQCVMKNRAIYA